MIKAEFRHYLLRSGLLILIPVWFFLRLFLLFQTEYYVDTDLDRRRDRYEGFYETYGGKINSEQRKVISEDPEWGSDPVVRRYVDYASERPAERNLVWPVGWEAWIGGPRFDYATILCLLFLIAYLFGSDGSLQMNEWKRIAAGSVRELYLARVFLFLLLFSALQLGSFGMDFCFYKVRYGLDSFDAPVQSLLSYSNASLSLTLMQTACLVSLLKMVGELAFCAVGILIIVAVSRFWPGLLASSGLFLVPLMIFPAELYKTPVYPYDLLLGNVFLRGSSDLGLFDSLVLIFPNRSYESWEAPLAVLISAVLFSGSILLGGLILKFRYRSRIGIVPVLLSGAVFIVTVLPAFPFLMKEPSLSEIEQKGRIESARLGVSSSDRIYLYDSETRSVASDGSAQRTIHLLFDEEVNYRPVFAGEETVLYIADEDGLQSVWECDPDGSFLKKLYEEQSGLRTYKVSHHFLGLAEDRNKDHLSLNEEEAGGILSAWKEEDYLFLLYGNSLDVLNLKTGKKRTILDEYFASPAYSLENGVFCYVDHTGEACCLEIATGVIKKTGVKNAAFLYLVNGEVYYYSFTEGSNLYRVSNGESVGLNVNQEDPTKTTYLITDTIQCVDDGFYALVEGKKKIWYYNCTDQTSMIYDIAPEDGSDDKVRGFLAFGDGTVLGLVPDPEEPYASVLKKLTLTPVNR